ncbi:uncharacterized protein LOC132743910 [Ruditapes philippinarum]|uniref:uncharacterized protein LOC132743910 n=1 Tax=Ruditapes philippinarum TaxID=129788 RepID=UPI00295AB3BD|nr:uncharacterized protein LOC132743910 [Ruditapes philippinarum]
MNTSVAPVKEVKDQTVEELSVKVVECVYTEPVPPFGMDYKRYSSVTMLFRVTALVQRFIKKLKRIECENDHLINEELQEAETRWIKFVQRKHYMKDFVAVESKRPSALQKQLGLYIDDKGVMRCIGRLDNSDLLQGARRPILLPKSDRLTELIIEKAHKECMHFGVSHTLAKTRQKYWITHGRSIVKSTLRKCAICKKHEGGPYKMPPMAPLPPSRVQVSPAFSRIGLDYLGPLNIKYNEELKKVWICIFSCMITRAIHLETVQDMTSEEFLLAFKRFIAQRGTPCEVVSDNATQFKLASKVIHEAWNNITKCEDVQSYVSSLGINWHFIVD